MPRPHIRIRVGASKGGPSRRAPLWWDGGTLTDLAEWNAHRGACGGKAGDPFVASLQAGREAMVLSRFTLRNGFQPPVGCLGRSGYGRLRFTTGATRSSAMHWRAGTLAEVRDAAEHSNVSITSGYLHVAVEDQAVGAMFS